MNGVTYVVESARRELENLGHEVFIICPMSRQQNKHDDHIIRIPGVRLPGSGQDGPKTSFSLLLARHYLRVIRKLDLDIIHIYTPVMCGLLGLYIAKKTGIHSVTQYCTDALTYLDSYPLLKMAGFLGNVLLRLFSEVAPEQKQEIRHALLPQMHTGKKWSRRSMETMVKVFYNVSDAVIAVSDKSAEELVQVGVNRKKITVMPTGVNPLPKVSPDDVTAFKRSLGIKETDQVMLYVGRIAREKNLEFLFPVLEQVLISCPETKLLFVGDNEYRAVVEETARRSSARNQIIFAGALPHDDLGKAYAAGDVFVFPSLTDTQGLVLHEAAGAGLPIVLMDRGVSQVLVDGENGYLATPAVGDFATCVVEILQDADLRREFSRRSYELADEYSEIIQTRKQVKLYDSVRIS
jgi:glycosyltransferase involved in cell wall biosynthesis